MGLLGGFLEFPHRQLSSALQNQYSTRTLTLLLTMPNRSKKEERVLPPRRQSTMPSSRRSWFNSNLEERREREVGRAGEMRWKFRTKRGSPRSAAAPPRSVPLSPSSSSRRRAALPQPQLHESFEREPRETGIMRRGAARARSLFSPKDLSNVRRKRRMATTARTAAADLKAFGKGVKRGRGRGL